MLSMHDDFDDTTPTKPAPLYGLGALSEEMNGGTPRPYGWSPARDDPRPKWRLRLIYVAIFVVVLCAIPAIFAA